MELLDTYLKNNGCKIYRDEDAHKIYERNKKLIHDICGPQMDDQLDSLVDSYDKDEDPEAILLLITNFNDKPIAIFRGEISKGELSSDITCSNELKKGGVLLRFYALLIVNESHPEITKLIGGISGGIPPLKASEPHEVVVAKQKKLHDYHLSNGATIDGNIFTYKLDDVKNKIRELFSVTGGKKRKTKKRTLKKRKVIKKRTRYSRRK